MLFCGPLALAAQPGRARRGHGARGRVASLRGGIAIVPPTVSCAASPDNSLNGLHPQARSVRHGFARERRRAGLLGRSLSGHRCRPLTGCHLGGTLAHEVKLGSPTIAGRQGCTLRIRPEALGLRSTPPACGFQPSPRGGMVRRDLGPAQTAPAVHFAQSPSAGSVPHTLHNPPWSRVWDISDPNSGNRVSGGVLLGTRTGCSRSSEGIAPVMAALQQRTPILGSLKLWHDAGCGSVGIPME